MLGKLARWLIILGYDARYGASDLSDLELLEQAHREGRIFLTRDLKIPKVAGLTLYTVRPKAFEGQLQDVARAFGLTLDPARAFTRCTYCNEPLRLVPREEALPLVPPLVRGLETPFSRCPKCKRMYWTGTHTERSLQKLKALGL
jgi:uncharacterized protein with PIN domain